MVTIFLLYLLNPMF